MSPSPYSERKADFPSGRSIQLINEGEHHMGCSVIVFVLSTPLAGIERFFTTNGAMLIAEPPDFCFLTDSSIIVRIDTQTWTASHLPGPLEARFDDLRLEGRDLSYDLLPLLHDSEPEGRRIFPGTSDWVAGLGPAAEGFFPSAYRPACKPG